MTETFTNKKFLMIYGTPMSAMHIIEILALATCCAAGWLCEYNTVYTDLIVKGPLLLGIIQCIPSLDYW